MPCNVANHHLALDTYYNIAVPTQDLNLKQAILATTSKGQLPTTQSSLRQHLTEVTFEECQNLVVGYLQNRTSEILKLMPPRYPEPHQSLNDLGFNSMMAMELRHRIETELEVDIPPKEFIGSSTLAQVAGHLLDQLVSTSVIQSEPFSSGLHDDSEDFIL